MQHGCDVLISAHTREFPKIRGTLFWVLVIGILVFRVL